jgi:ribosomal protein S1
VLSLASVLAVQVEIAATVVGVGVHRDRVQVQVSLSDLSVPPVTEQITALGIVPGHQLTGRLNNVNPSLGLFVEVAPKVNGLVHLSGLPRGTTDGFEVGAFLEVEVIKVAENPRKPGSVNIGLRFM